MESNFKLSDKVRQFIEGAITTNIGIGCSNSQVVRIQKENETYFLKIAPLGELTSEYEKLIWLAGKIKVPEVILYEINDDVEYLITSAVVGEMICSDFYLKDDNWKLGIPLIIEAFKELYKIDINDCPFNVSLDYKLTLIKNNIDNKLLALNNISEEVLDKFKTLDNIYRYLINNRFDEELCFTHGDVSLPNLFVDNGKFSGFIDVGECGIADKWFDLAIAVKTIKRNYGEDAVNILFEQLGIIKDENKINYYILMMELYL